MVQITPFYKSLQTPFSASLPTTLQSRFFSGHTENRHHIFASFCFLARGGGFGFLLGMIVSVFVELYQIAMYDTRKRGFFLFSNWTTFRNFSSFLPLMTWESTPSCLHYPDVRRCQNFIPASWTVNPDFNGSSPNFPRICLILRQGHCEPWRHGPPHDAVPVPFVSASLCIQLIPFAASSSGNTSRAYSSTPLHPAHRLLASSGAESSRPK